jgi:hypothetical protein
MMANAATTITAAASKGKGFQGSKVPKFMVQFRNFQGSGVPEFKGSWFSAEVRRSGGPWTPNPRTLELWNFRTLELWNAGTLEL